MDTICDACRAIDFGKVFQVPVEVISTAGMGVLLEEGTCRFANPESFTCPLCRLLSASLCPCAHSWSEPTVRDHATLDLYDLRALSFTTNCSWAQGHGDLAHDCHILLAIRGMISSNGGYEIYIKKEFGYVVCLPKERQERQFVPRVIPDRFDVQKARSWVQSCKKNHANTCSENVAIIPGMRIIDCETLEIVEAESGMVWVALSYVWSDAKSDVKSDSDSTDSGALAFPQHVSRTIRDAIKVTQDMGYRYLWIDRYCINQEDGVHKSSQIEQMDAIYRGADLTIIAAAGQDENYGLPGVGTTKRKKQQQIVELESCTILSTGPDPSYETQQSRWASRGWTFQEGLLSRRRLYFTDTQSWFECGNACWMEGLSGPQPCKSSDAVYATAGLGASLHGQLSSYHKIQKTSAEDHDLEIDERYFHFGHHMLFIEKYTGRNLTFDSDSLAAFAGVSRHLQSTGPQESHILGIPYMPSILGGDFAETYFVHLLCWFHTEDIVPRRRPQFPSWTWAGWAGVACWIGDYRLKYSDARPKIRHLQFRDHEEAIPFETYLRAWSQNKPQVNERNIALCFEARLVPPSLFSMDQNTKRKDEGSRRSSLDPRDWRNWRVGKHKLCATSRPPEFSPVQLVEQLQNGQWGCLLLGDYYGHDGYRHRRFILVVEWLADGTAHRIGSVVLRVHPYRDQDIREFFDDADLSWKSVHLL
jgi:hypothetical protein